MDEHDQTAITPARNWINGAWNGAGAIKESISPSTGKVLGTFVDIGTEEARLAIEAARTAFDISTWSQDHSLRSRALFELADRIEARAPAIARMLSREGGKLHPQTQWELQGSVDWLRYAAAIALTHTGGRAMETAPGVHFRSDPEPMGVVGVISPWNSPIILSVRAIGPALAAGCTVVLKLPHQTALTNGLFSEAIAATKLLPQGVLNTITESGSIGASMLVDSPEVNAISYTGSTKTGRLIAANGAKTLKRLNLELGGKTPLVVFDDVNLDAIVPQIVTALLAMNGQFCCTGSRVLVQRGIADAMRAALITAYQNVQLGESEDPSAQLGPVIDIASVKHIDRIVEEAKTYAKILVRGGPVTDGPLANGAFYKPCLIEVEPLDAFIVQNELFGPIQTFEIFDDEADAIRRANGTEFGLAASVFTSDATRARRVAKAIRASQVWLNCWGVLSEYFEHKGYKHSGIGFLSGPRALEEFQEIKVYGSVDAVAAPAI
jgi:betaine-aldehyde dehydrogenase